MREVSNVEENRRVDQTSYASDVAGVVRIASHLVCTRVKRELG